VSLFTKTIVVRGGMSRADVDTISKGIEEFALAIRESFASMQKEIEELRNEVNTLKHEPRMSVAQKLRAKQEVKNAKT